jgi:hypothetical protein
MEIKQLTLQEIDELIKASNPDRFLGVIETTYFEFREKPYQPNNEHNGTSREKSRLELIKDFSSIANSGGGYIIIGLKPELDVSKFNLEFVKEVKGVKSEDIAWQSWLDTLSSYLTPPVREAYVKHGFIGNEKQIFWLRVPDAELIGCFPFVINKDQWVTEEDTLIKGTLYGVYFRDGASNKQVLSAEKIQGLIKQSLSEPNAPLISTTEISTKLDQIIALHGQADESSKDFELKKNELVKLMEDRLDPDSDFFYLMAIPEKPSNLTSEVFWAKGEDSLYQLIDNPPTLRHMGWDLHTASIEYPEPKGEAWESTNGSRKIVRVDKQGVIVVGGTIQEFLDWGLRGEGEEGEPKINAFAMDEFILSFTNFLSAYTKKYPSPNVKNKILGGVVLRNEKNYELAFSVGFFFGQKTTALSKREWDFGDFGEALINKPSRLAGFIVFEIYARGFGFVSENPPYLIKGDGGAWVINEKLYKKSS